MIPIDGGRLALASRSAGQLLGLVDVLQINSERLFRALHDLIRFGQFGDTLRSHRDQWPIVELAEFDDVRSKAEELRDICDELKLLMSARMAGRVIASMDKARRAEGAISDGYIHLKYPLIMPIAAEILELGNRLNDEVSIPLLLSIDATKASYFEQASGCLFGPGVADAFPLAVEDIGEAGKCFALERNTACVFHLMRALEHATQAVADKLGAAVTDEHGRGLPWGVIAENMKSKIDKLPKGGDEQIRWYRAQSYLVVLNRAWRAPTAHPKQTYTEEEAEAVFAAAKSFMNELVPLVT